MMQAVALSLGSNCSPTRTLTKYLRYMMRHKFIFFIKNSAEKNTQISYEVYLLSPKVLVIALSTLRRKLQNTSKICESINIQ